jgi:hypothetical protein
MLFWEVFLLKEAHCFGFDLRRAFPFISVYFPIFFELVPIFIPNRSLSRVPVKESDKFEGNVAESDDRKTRKNAHESKVIVRVHHNGQPKPTLIAHRKFKVV